MKDDIDAVVARLTKESVAAAGAQGFITGLGGLLTAGVTIPANVAASFAVNMRMAGAIAHLRGWDIRDPHARTVAMMLAIGMSTQRVLAAFGVKAGQKFGEQMIKKIPIAMIRAINKKAGTHLVAKYGTQRAAITLAKGIPNPGGPCRRSCGRRSDCCHRAGHGQGHAWRHPAGRGTEVTKKRTRCTSARPRAGPPPFRTSTIGSSAKVVGRFRSRGWGRRECEGGLAVVDGGALAVGQRDGEAQMLRGP
ncbi:hypothetical protein [Streptomyces sp. NPDC018833]|uniref:hypothetical protein n=1 Tax=Streptomyces sp. NPDC018833 TaxID=3365053 RepID=UPI0037A5AC56